MGNEKIIEITKKQMEKVSAGINIGTDCYFCSGTTDKGKKECGRSLQHVSGKLYRCNNPKCSKFGDDQYPAGY